MTANVQGHRHDRTALVLYGSETGNSQDVAEDLGRVTERLRFLTRVSEMDAVEIRLLPKYSVVIFAISTTGQGEFPKNTRKFWKSLLRKRLPPGCFDHVFFTTFGLGDSSYPKFNWAARKLHKRLEQLCAKEIYPRGEADEQHEEGIYGTFLSWSLDFRKHLLTLFPLPEGVTPIPDEVLLPPKFTIKFLEAPTEHQDLVSNRQENSPRELPSRSDIDGPSKNFSKVVQGDTMKYITPRVVHEPSVGPHLQDGFDDEVDFIESKLPPRDWIPIPDGFRVQLIENKRVTPTDHWQDVRLLTIHMEKENEYWPGDTITIFPKNFPKDVQTLINLQDWQSVADTPLKFEATSPDFFADPHLVTLPTGIYPLKESTLRDLLTHNFDITAIPKPFFFAYISHFTADATHKGRLLEFSNSAYRDEYYDYATRPRRSILEVLADFPSVKLPFKDIPSLFPAIRGREFSICSGGLGSQVPRSPRVSKDEPDIFQKVQLLVAIVKYRTVLRKVRQGLCSRYIAALQPDTKLNIKLNNNESFYKIPCQNPELSVVMVAAGTGIAPCRSLVWERAKITAERELRDDSPAVGQNVLIYGGRNKDKDFFFKKEWASAALRTEVLTAFSRDQRQKIYVQDVVRREGRKLAQLILEGKALLYVCGSSGNMPKAVKEALLQVIVEFGSDVMERSGVVPAQEVDRGFAETCLGEMEKTGRYVQETW